MPERRHFAGGKITVYLSRHRSLPALARGVLAYLTGRLKNERDVERIETAGVVLHAARRREVEAMIDGESLRLPLPLELRVRPAALRVLFCGKEEG